MSLTPENELTIRRGLADKTALVEEIGFVMPAPLDLADKGDFWAVFAPKLNRAELETTPVKFCAIYPVQSEDLPENGQSEPLIELAYEFYLFHERSSKRVDESETPDAFNKKLLKSHSDFVAAWLNLRAEFLGKQKLDLGAEFAVSYTNSLKQPDEINNRAKCEFVPGVTGFEVKLRLIAKILLKEC